MTQYMDVSTRKVKHEAVELVGIMYVVGKTGITVGDVMQSNMR